MTEAATDDSSLRLSMSDGGVKRVRLFGRPAAQFQNGYSASTSSSAPAPVDEIRHLPTASSSSAPSTNGTSSSASLPKLPAVPLTPSAFAPYGSVLQSYPDARCAPKSIPIKQVNFGTAQKYNFLSPTASPAPLPGKWAAQGIEQKLNMCVFRCEPQNKIGNEQGKWEVRVLERHEFSSQSFMPMGTEGGSYLVLVALPGQGELELLWIASCSTTSEADSPLRSGPV